MFGVGLGCFGLVAVIAVYVVLGFMLAWIAGAVAKEDVEVKTGVIVLVVTGILSVLINIGIGQIAPSIVTWTWPIVNFGLLVLLLNLIAKLSWKHSGLIAAIYTLVLGGIMTLLSFCSDVATSSG